MYQGMQSQLQGYNNNYYQNANPYGAQYQQRYVPETGTPVYSTFSSGTYIKGRPVLSYDEAKASQIDLDGSLHVFTDIGNKKIYTKQLNLDGTATLNTYALVDNEVPTPPEFVTKAEFEQALTQIQTILNSLNTKEEKKTSLNF